MNTHGNQPPLLSVQDLCMYYPVWSNTVLRRQVGVVKACDNVSFTLARGKTLGIVGESGSGKTTTGRAIIRALTPTSGRVQLHLDNKTVDLARMSEKELRPYRPRMQMIFQDPYSSLNPRMTVGEIVGEPLLVHRRDTAKPERRDQVVAMLERVGLKAEHYHRYPHAFSGGQRQRVGIARALVLQPELIVADEAVSALDVSVQAQIINLLQDLQNEFGVAYIFIAHDLSVVRHLCDEIAVMYGGRLVEQAETETLFDDPKHPYTRALLSAIPSPDPRQKMRFEAQGEVADPANLPDGCSFHPRCPECFAPCDSDVPQILATKDGTRVACHLYDEEKAATGAASE